MKGDQEQKSRQADYGTVEILTLEGRLRKAETELSDLELRLPLVQDEVNALRNALANARGRQSEPTKTRGTDDEDRKYAGLGGKSIHEQVREFFASKPGAAFSPAEVMACLRIPVGNIEAVRASFKRLTGRDEYLRHVGHAQYELKTSNEGS